jgi:hypothetical protein
MTITNPSPTRAPFDQERVRSKAVLSVDWTRGVATAITGQGATVTRAGNAFVTAVNGVLTRIGANRPRLLHFVGANGGLLTEGARTNLFQRSEEFDDAAWTKVRATVAANSAIAPNGTLTADTLLDDATLGDHKVRQSISVTSGTTYTLSAFVKAGSLSFVWLYAGTPNVGRFFNLSTGTTLGVIGGAPSSSSIVPLGNGWFRCAISYVAGATSAQNQDIGTSPNGTTLNYSGTGQGVFLWGAQLEAGPNASTYTPTVAATVTRPTDQVSYDNFPQPAEIAARGGITVYHRFVELGTRDTPTGMYLRVGDGVETTTASTRTLRIRQGVTPAGPSALLSNGTAVIGAGRANPQIGDTVEQLCQVRYTAAGNTFAVLFSQAINGIEASGAVFSTELDATALIASGWETTPTLYVGARDGGNQAGFQLNQAFKARFGIHDLASMRTLV